MRVGGDGLGQEGRRRVAWLAEGQIEGRPRRRVLVRQQARETAERELGEVVETVVAHLGASSLVDARGERRRKLTH